MNIQTIHLEKSNISISYNINDFFEKRFVAKMQRAYTFKPQGAPKKEFSPEHETIIKFIVEQLQKQYIYPSPERVAKILKSQHNITLYGRVCLSRKLKELKLENTN